MSKIFERLIHMLLTHRYCRSKIAIWRIVIDAKSRSSEYEKFMRELTLFTVIGKNLHDDAPDSLAMLTDFITGGIKMVKVAMRPL